MIVLSRAEDGRFRFIRYLFPMKLIFQNCRGAAKQSALNYSRQLMASDEVNDRIKQQKQKKVITESDGPISLL